MTLLTDLYAAGARDLSWSSMEGGGLIPHDGVSALNIGSPITSAFNHFSEVVDTDLASNDHQAKESVYWNQADSNAQPFDYIGTIVRANFDDLDYYYAGYIQETGSGHNTVFINKVTGGVHEDGPALNDQLTSFVEDSVHTLELFVSGNTTTHLSFKIDGVERVSWDDSTSPLFGVNNRKVGHVGLVGSGTDFLWHFERFDGQDTGGSPPPPTGDPTNLVVTQVSSHAHLVWDASSGALDYSVFRRTPQTGLAFDPGTDTPLVSGIAGLSYDDNTVSPANYDYQVFGRLT